MCDGTSSISSSGNLVDEARRLGGLVVAEHAPPRRRRQHQPSLRARDADVAEPPLLLELRLVVGRARVRKQALLEAADDHDRELQSLGAVHRHHQHPGVLGPGFLVDVRQQRQLIDEASRATAPACVISYSRAADTSSSRFSIRPSASSLRSSRRSCR